MEFQNSHFRLTMNLAGIFFYYINTSWVLLLFYLSIYLFKHKMTNYSLLYFSTNIFFRIINLDLDNYSIVSAQLDKKYWPLNKQILWYYDLTLNAKADFIWELSFWHQKCWHTKMSHLCLHRWKKCRNNWSINFQKPIIVDPQSHDHWETD